MEIRVAKWLAGPLCNLKAREGRLDLRVLLWSPQSFDLPVEAGNWKEFPLQIFTEKRAYYQLLTETPAPRGLTVTVKTLGKSNKMLFFFFLYDCILQKHILGLTTTETVITHWFFSISITFSWKIPRDKCLLHFHWMTLQIFHVSGIFPFFSFVCFLNYFTPLDFYVVFFYKYRLSFLAGNVIVFFNCLFIVSSCFAQSHHLISLCHFNALWRTVASANCVKKW